MTRGVGMNEQRNRENTGWKPLEIVCSDRRIAALVAKPGSQIAALHIRTK
jgi:hypothetical protein